MASNGVRRYLFILLCFCCARASVDSLGQQPIAYWDFETGMQHSVPTEGASTLVGGEASSIGLVEGAAIGGRCLEIRQGGGYLRLPLSLIDNTTTAYTIALWFRYEDVLADGASETNTLIEIAGGEGRLAKAWLRPFGAGKTLCSWAGGSAERHQDYELWPQAGDGAWHHFALSIDLDSDLLLTYVDGALVNREQLAENGGAFRPMSSLVIGDSTLHDGDQTWDGQIDEVVLYDHALTANQVAALAAGESVWSLPLPVPDPPIAPAIPFQTGSWQFAVLPDLQKYVWRTGADTELLHSIMDWLVAEKDQLDIGFVGTVGDLTAKNLPVHWGRIRPAFAKLDGVLPYVLCLGNHDTGANGWARERDTMPVNDYFDLTDNPLIDPGRGGTFRSSFETLPDGDAAFESTVHELVAPDGQEWLLFSLEFSPRQAVVDWAAEVCDREEYRNHVAVLFVHSYLYENDQIYRWPDYNDADGTQFGNPHGTHLAIPDDDVHDGTDLWEELIKPRRQFRMVFCGSVSASDGTGYRNTRNEYGDQVHQMLFDPEWRYRGGNGFFRLIELLPGGRKAQVRSFSPYLEGLGMFPYITTPDCQFEIEIDPVFADYGGWVRAMGVSSPERGSDPDGDGLANLAEFGLVTHPGRQGANPVSLRRASDGAWMLDFPLRRHLGDFGVEVSIQQSSGVASGGWQELAKPVRPLDPELVSRIYGEADPRAEWQSVEVSPDSSQGTAFYRLAFDHHMDR